MSFGGITESDGNTFFVEIKPRSLNIPEYVSDNIHRLYFRPLNKYTELLPGLFKTHTGKLKVPRYLYIPEKFCTVRYNSSEFFLPVYQVSMFPFPITTRGVADFAIRCLHNFPLPYLNALHEQW